MSEPCMRIKKGKNFKEVIDEEKNKGKTVKKIMRIITSLSTSVIYGGSFLLSFISMAAVIYFLFAPTVFVWAGILVVVALVSSLFASRLAGYLRKSQWKYKSF